MMAYERSESAHDNFGKSTHQFQPKSKTLIMKLERIFFLPWTSEKPNIPIQTILEFEKYSFNPWDLMEHTEKVEYSKIFW